MNELENFYEQNEGIASRFSSAQQNLEMERRGIMGTKGQQDDLEAEAQADKDAKVDKGGGDTATGGMGETALFQVAKGQVSKAIKGKLRDAVQSKIDDIQAQKTASNVETKDPAPDDAYARSQPDLDIQQGQGIADSRTQAQNLKGRMDNMDSASKQNVMDEYNSDPAKINNPSSASDYENNVRVMEGKVKAQESDPSTKFADEDINNPAPTQSTTTTSSTTAQTRTPAQQQALDDAQLGGDTDATGGGALSGQTGGANTTTIQGSTDDAIENVSSNLKSISQKGMDSLSDKLGVDFGDLAPEDIGGALSGELASAGGDMLGALGGVVGTALDFLGPIGILAGLITTGVGLAESSKDSQDAITKKQNDLQTLADNINTTGGMSFGSIASTPLDTSQMRSGGATMNF